MGKKIGLWAITILPGALLILGGISKLLAMPPHPEHFAHFGYPLWFMYVTGAIELVGALALLVPRTATLGSLLLSATMVGAVFTHLKMGEGPQAIPALVVLALVATVGWLRRDRLRELIGSDGESAATAAR